MPVTFWTGYVEKLALVALVLAALYLVARRLRQGHPFSRGARCLRLIETEMLSPHAGLHVVRAGSRHFLIGSAAGGVSRLAELNASDAAGAESAR